MSDEVKLEIKEGGLDQVAQNYFRHRQKSLKPSDFEGLIRQFDADKEFGQTLIARRA